MDALVAIAVYAQVPTDGASVSASRQLVTARIAHTLRLPARLATSVPIAGAEHRSGGR